MNLKLDLLIIVVGHKIPYSNKVGDRFFRSCMVVLPSFRLITTYTETLSNNTMNIR